MTRGRRAAAEAAGAGRRAIQEAAIAEEGTALRDGSESDGRGRLHRVAPHSLGSRCSSPCRMEAVFASLREALLAGDRLVGGLLVKCRDAAAREDAVRAKVRLVWTDGPHLVLARVWEKVTRRKGNATACSNLHSLAFPLCPLGTVWLCPFLVAPAVSRSLPVPLLESPMPLLTYSWQQPSARRTKRPSLVPPHAPQQSSPAATSPLHRLPARLLQRSVHPH